MGVSTTTLVTRRIVAFPHSKALCSPSDHGYPIPRSIGTFVRWDPFQRQDSITEKPYVMVFPFLTMV